MTKSEQYALADALAAAQALCDTSAESLCSVKPEHKTAVKGYVQAWVIPSIRMALEHSITGESAALAAIYRRGAGFCKNQGAAKILDDLQKEA